MVAWEGVLGRSSLYADLTENKPFVFGIHMSLSELGLEGVGMERIALADMGLKISRTMDVLQVRCS